ncbi:MAG: hypothetical protein JSR18_12875 [Proteobacteria bacterium]|nr:hypothetical protein [Pseudomonadota bacterium]
MYYALHAVRWDATGCRIVRARVSSVVTGGDDGPVLQGATEYDARAVVALAKEHELRLARWGSGARLSQRVVAAMLDVGYESLELVDDGSGLTIRDVATF